MNDENKTALNDEQIERVAGGEEDGGNWREMMGRGYGVDELPDNIRNGQGFGGKGHNHDHGEVIL